jgi:SET domain-containing protein
MTDKIPENLPDIKYDNTKVYVQFSDVHGRGVFAKNPIELHDVIETFPITPCLFRTNYQGDPTVIHYSFVNDACHCEECNKHGPLIYLSSGYANMYNHQDPESSNARFEINFKELYGKVIANKTIKIDEEILVDYGPHYSFPKGKVTNHEDSPR